MPRYYFHVKSGQVTVLDHEGLELPDSKAAAEEAARGGREIASREGRKDASTGMSIVVADERWWPVFEVPFDDTGTC